MQLYIYKVDLNMYYSLPYLCVENCMITIHIMWLYVYLATVTEFITTLVPTSVNFPDLVTIVMLYRRL